MPTGSHRRADDRGALRRGHDPTGPRSRRRWLVGGLVCLALLVPIGVELTRDVLAVREALHTVHRELSSARSAAARGDFPEARERLAAAGSPLAGARAHTHGLGWRIGARIPGVGRSFRVVRGVVEVAHAATDVAHGALDRADGLVARDGGLNVEVRDGAVPLAPLRRAARIWGGLDPAPLARASDGLAAIPATGVPASVRAARRDALEAADHLLGSLRRVDALLGVLPDFLGDRGARHYLLAFQNNAELRGTGGLIGSYAELTIEDGAPSLSRLRSYGALSGSGDPRFADHRPVSVGREFQRRYRHVDATGFVANVNVDPDLPTTARVLLDLYKARTGRRLDGVIAVDPVGLGMLLGPIGPIALPAGADPTGRLPNPVPPGELARVTMVDAYDVLGGHREARRVYLRRLTQAAFARLIGGGWDAAAVGRQIAAAGDLGHLQLFSAHGDEQEAFASLGVDGSLPVPGSARGGTPGDLLGVSANNAGGNKMDVHVGHTLSGEIMLDSPRGGWVTREADLRIGVDNPLPGSGRDPYIIGNCAITGGTGGCFDGPAGLNRTWFTVWAPASTDLRRASDAAGAALVTGVGRIHGHLAVDHHLETGSRSSNYFEVRLRGPVRLDRQGSDVVYRLDLWRQTKAIADRIDLSISAPEGWSVVDVTVTGGGDGSGMGVHKPPGPPLLVGSESSGRVRVHGDRNADVQIELRLRRPTAARVLDWLRDPLG